MTHQVDSSTSTAWSVAVDALWRDQSRWSSRANELAGKHRSWIGPLALFGLSGVVLSTLTPEMLRWFGLTEDDSSATRIVVTLIGPMIVAITAYLSRELIGPKTEQLWVRAREISEALKAEGFIYATGAPPYGDPEAAPLALNAKLTQLTEDAAAFGPLPPADEARVRKNPHQPMDEATYVALRVQGQIRWHENGGRGYHKQLEYLRLGSLLLGLTSVVLGVVAGALDSASLNIWIAVVSTAVATLTSYAYAGRYEFLASSYFDTAARLEKRLRTRQLEKHGPQAFARFVLDCEAVLAGQNRSWSQKLFKRTETESASTQVSEPKDAPIAGPP